MKPIITIYLSLILVAALAELGPAFAGPPAQISTSGITLNVQKENAPRKAYAVKKWQLKVEVSNLSNITNIIDVGIYLINGNSKFVTCHTPIIQNCPLPPAGKQIIKTDPIGEMDYQGYIVLVTSEDKVIKFIASNKELENITNNPDKISKLKSSEIVPLTD